MTANLAPYEKLSKRLKRYAGRQVHLSVLMDDYGEPFAICILNDTKIEHVSDEWQPPRNVAQTWGGKGEKGGSG